MPIDPRQLEPTASSRATYDATVAEFERDVIRRTDEDMRGRAVHVVHATLVERLNGRLPGVHMSDCNLRTIARAISNGTLRDHLENSRRPV